MVLSAVASTLLVILPSALGMSVLEAEFLLLESLGLSPGFLNSWIVVIAVGCVFSSLWRWSGRYTKELDHAQCRKSPKDSANTHPFPSATPRSFSSENIAKLREDLVVRDLGDDALRIFEEEMRIVYSDVTREYPDTDSPFHEPIDAVVVGRFLMSARLDREAATQNLKAYIAWRYELNGAVVAPRSYLQNAAILAPFADKLGRPVIFMLLRRFLLKNLPLQELEAGFCATLDATLAYCLSQRDSGGQITNPTDQFVCIIDIAGATPNNFSLDALKMIMHVARTRYAESVALVYIVNPSKIAVAIWKAVKHLVAERTQKIIHMVPSAEVAQTMACLVGENSHSLLPPEFGGAAPVWPEPHLCTTIEDQVGALAATAWRSMGTVSQHKSSMDSKPSFAENALDGCFGCMPSTDDLKRALSSWQSAPPTHG